MEWISVNNKLPKEWGTYIVCLENKTVHEMNFSNFGENIWFSLAAGGEYKNNKVTHWMKLPKPPKN